MQIQVSTDNHIQGSAELTQNITAMVEATLDRFRERITRVEVHLGDENSAEKGGDDDKRCKLEVRLAGRQPTTVTHHAPSIELAVEGAAEKMEKLLTSTLGRLDDVRHRNN
jgi:ribosome-associated translation inhibitor RaiA